MEKIKGYIEHFIYKNTENGYGVLNLVVSDDEVVCTGVFRDVDVGDTIEAEGEYVSHPVYGDQFKVSSYEISVPDDAASMQRYLGSGAIRGIGEALAKRIVSKFGEDTFRIIEEEPERLSEIKGISEKKAMDIALQMAEKREMRNAMIFLQQFGISDNLAVKIYNTYGERIYKVIKENPYQLSDDIAGVGFKTADEIAGKVGIQIDSDYRIKSGIYYALLQSSLDGNTYLPVDELIRRTIDVLSTRPDYEINEEMKQLRTNIQFAGADKKVILITSSAADEGKSSVALELARSMAELGKKVLLLDTDMRKSVLAEKTEAGEHTEARQHAFGASAERLQQPDPGQHLYLEQPDGQRGDPGQRSGQRHTRQVHPDPGRRP